MWMAEVEKVPFTWLDGHTYNIKDIKLIPEYEQAVMITLNEEDQLDEIASRPEIFGEGSESLTYLLFEANVVKLTEAKFNMNKLHELRIPATR